MKIKGFTLVELLIVIGILAVLSAVTILVLNPAQLFAQARDSQRISDLATLSSAINFFISTASTSPADGSMCNGDSHSDCDSSCWTHLPTGSGLSGSCGARFSGSRSTVVYNTQRYTDGTGWVPINLQKSTGGSPISSLPVDPVANTTYFYSYATYDEDKTFEIDAKMESTRYSANGSDDREKTDGGNNDALYEIGNAPGLTL